MSATDLLIVTPKETEELKKCFGKTDTEIAEYVQILKTWLGQQPHLPNIETDLRLTNFLILNKFGLEKTKMKLDNYYTFRNAIPELFHNREPLNPDIQKAMTCAAFVPLPKLTPELARVQLFKIIDLDVDLYQPNDFLKISLLVTDVRMTLDFCQFEIFIFDMSNMTIGHIVKFTPMMVKNIHNVLEKAFSNRINAIHFINSPSYAASLISLVKSVFKEKLANRIHIHQDLESLYAVVPKEILPSDYDGKERSVLELQADWKALLESKNDWFLKEGSMATNENVRPAKSAGSDILGYDGSFRKLNID